MGDHVGIPGVVLFGQPQCTLLLVVLYSFVYIFIVGTIAQVHTMCDDDFSHLILHKASYFMHDVQTTRSMNLALQYYIRVEPYIINFLGYKNYTRK